VKYFIAIEEDLLLKLWMLDPQLVAPFSRSFGLRKVNPDPASFNINAADIEIQAQLLAPATGEHERQRRKGD